MRTNLSKVMYVGVLSTMISLSITGFISIADAASDLFFEATGSPQTWSTTNTEIGKNKIDFTDSADNMNFQGNDDSLNMSGGNDWLSLSAGNDAISFYGGNSIISFDAPGSGQYWNDWFNTNTGAYKSYIYSSSPELNGQGASTLTMRSDEITLKVNNGDIIIDLGA